ncbi:TPM2 [Sanghuangporus vaninii]
MTDRIKERLQTLRAEADAATERAEGAEARNKKYEQILLEKDQEITSLNHKLGVLDAQLEATEAKLAEAKAAKEEGELSKTTNEGLQRKIQLLEDELDAAERNAKETMEKLRQVDIKADHFERQTQNLQREILEWEQKYEASQEKFRKAQAELDELVQSMENL